MRTVPVSWRAPVKRRLFDAMRQDGGRTEPEAVLRASFDAFLET